MPRQKTLATKIFKLEDYDNVTELYEAVRDFQRTHNTVLVFANELFSEDPKVEVLYSKIPFGISRRPMTIVN